MAKVVIDRLVTELTADRGPLNRVLFQSEADTRSWAQKTRAHVNTSATAFAGMAVAGQAALMAIYVNAARSGDALAKLSDEIAEAPERITALQHAAELTGTSTDKFNTSLERMVKRLGEAQNGSGSAAKYIEQLGLNTSEFFALSPADQFAQISDSVNALESQQGKAAAAAAIFGREGLALINTMALGSEGLAAMEQEVTDLGVALNRLELAKIEAANDAFFRAKQVSAGFGNQLAAEVAPIVRSLADDFVLAAKEAGGFGVVAQRVVNTVATGIGVMSDGVHVVVLLFESLTQVVRELASVALSVYSKIGSGILLVAEAMGQSDSAVANSIRTFQEFADSFGQTNLEARESLQSAWLSKLPSQKIGEWMQDAQNKATAEAEKIAAKAASARERNASPVDTLNAKEQAAAEARKREFDRVVEGLRTEEEALQASYERRQAIILANTEAGGVAQIALLARLDDQVAAQRAEIIARQITDEDRKYEQMTSVQRYWTDLRAEYEQSSAQQRLEIGLGLMQQLTSGAARENKRMFELNKVAAIANAVVSTAQGMAKALEWGFPLGPIFAALIGAAGAIQIQSIKKQKFGGAGSVSPPSAVSTGAAGGGSQGIQSERVPNSRNQSSANNTEEKKVVVDFKNYERAGSIPAEAVLDILETIGAAVRISGAMREAERVGAIG